MAAAILLGAVAARLPSWMWRATAARVGRLSMARLLAEHGPVRSRAAHCPRWRAVGIHDRRGVHFPGLVG